MNPYSESQRQLILEHANIKELAGHPRLILAALLASHTGSIPRWELEVVHHLKHDLDSNLRKLVHYGYVIDTSQVIYLKGGLA
jgi:hypothetical protein